MKTLLRLAIACTLVAAPLGLAGVAPAQEEDYGEYYDYYDDTAENDQEQDPTHEYGDVGYKGDKEQGDIAEWREEEVFTTSENDEPYEDEEDDFYGEEDDFYDDYEDDEYYDDETVGYYDDEYYENDDWFSDYYDDTWDYDYEVYDAGYYDDGYYDDDWYYDYYDYGFDWGW